MRGQEHTVMSYLVWAVFATFFGIVVLVVANKIGQPAASMFWRQVSVVLTSAVKQARSSPGICQCAHSVDPIVFSDGFTLTPRYVEAFLPKGWKAYFVAGDGFRCEDDSIVAQRYARVPVVVCCKGSGSSGTCVLYFNKWFANSCSPPSPSSSRCSG